MLRLDLKIILPVLLTSTFVIVSVAVVSNKGEKINNETKQIKNVTSTFAIISVKATSNTYYEKKGENRHLICHNFSCNPQKLIFLSCDLKN